MGCQDAVAQLWDFLDQGLDGVDREQLEAHLAFCRRCCGELEFARELRRLLASRTESHLPPDVHERLDALIDGFAESQGRGTEP
ncbi:zf-HC2 domain-containing protein [Egibacter rhizosphaerae]|uniref:Zf-HC2 domain-containing protein n=1 Tax=Egibacter rhizosphaerae TaxID=1670831 RepID=A0A411YL98_9ACTN|nr:zf-HC2 domain-containing protein [Egibacter rhizosphaerae]